MLYFSMCMIAKCVNQTSYSVTLVMIIMTQMHFIQSQFSQSLTHSLAQTLYRHRSLSLFHSYDIVIVDCTTNLDLAQITQFIYSYLDFTVFVVVVIITWISFIYFVCCNRSAPNDLHGSSLHQPIFIRTGVSQSVQVFEYEYE